MTRPSFIRIEYVYPYSRRTKIYPPDQKFEQVFEEPSLAIAFQLLFIQHQHLGPNNIIDAYHAPRSGEWKSYSSGRLKETMNDILKSRSRPRVVKIKAPELLDDAYGCWLPCPWCEQNIGGNLGDYVNPEFFTVSGKLIPYQVAIENDGEFTVRDLNHTCYQCGNEVGWYIEAFTTGQTRLYQEVMGSQLKTTLFWERQYAFYEDFEKVLRIFEQGSSRYYEILSMLYGRYGKLYSVEEVAGHFGVTTNRIQQLVKKAQAQLRKIPELYQVIDTTLVRAHRQLLEQNQELEAELAAIKQELEAHRIREKADREERVRERLLALGYTPNEVAIAVALSLRNLNLTHNIKKKIWNFLFVDRNIALEDCPVDELLLRSKTDLVNFNGIAVGTVRKIDTALIEHNLSLKLE